VSLIAVSEAVAEELRQELDLDAHVVANGVSALPAAEPEVRDRPYLLSVGAVEPRKNLARLVAGYQASGLAGEVDLVLVGRSAWGELPPGVVWLGPVDDTRLAALYRGAAAVVSASLYEGFGLPVAEALAVGAPVVCSSIAAYREVTDGHARLFDPLSPASIADALRDAAEGLPRPPASFASRWSWERCADEHRAVYEQLLGEGP
jgi:glycosyltransferase involved in cell wall biosynthesis